MFWSKIYTFRLVNFVIYIWSKEKYVQIYVLFVDSKPLITCETESFLAWPRVNWNMQIRCSWDYCNRAISNLFWEWNTWFILGVESIHVHLDFYRIITISRLLDSSRVVRNIQTISPSARWSVYFVQHSSYPITYTCICNSLFSEDK